MESVRAELIDYAEIRRAVEVALDAGDLAKAKERLEQLVAHPDTTRDASENTFLYRSLGRLYQEIGMDDESLQALIQAYAFDSRDRLVLESMAKAAIAGYRLEDPMGVLQRLLVHHRHDLKSGFVAQVYRFVGAQHQAAGEPEHARVAYEKALENAPGDMDVINALLGIAEQSGDDQAMLSVREKLLASLSAPESRAAVLVAMGDDLLKRANDTVRAVDAFERALAEHAGCVPALLRVAEIAVRQEDWERALGSLVALAEHSDKDTAVKYLLKAALVAKDKLKDSLRAASTYEQVLDRDPLQLDAFKALVRLLLEQEEWPTLEKAYERMIARHNALVPKQPNVLVVLYRNLGELRANQLGNPRKAAQAYQAASELQPQEVNFHEILGRLYASNDDTLKQAIEQQREVLRLQPARVEAVEALARLYLRMERYDEALCLYRVLEALGRSDDIGRQVVERYHTPRPPRIDALLHEEMWERLVRPDYLERPLVKIFSLAYPALIECFAHDLEYYNLREKDARLNLEERSFFSTIFTNVARVLGNTALPAVYTNPRQRGVRNAYLLPPALMVGQESLAGRDEREMAFAIGKALALFRPEFYITQFSGTRVLDVVIFAVFKTFRPDVNVKMSKEMLLISKTLERKLKPTEQGALKTLVDDYLESGPNLNLRLFVEAAEDVANRVGLLFADDPKSALKVLEQEDAPLGSRGVPERFGSLLMWAISDSYLELRRAMNIAIA